MSLRIKKIQIKNFKAFQNLNVNLAGRHLLAYGANGSGKSSLYWALYTMLQSAGKSADQVQKYFDPAHKENLLNLHTAADTEGEINLTLQNDDGSVTHSYAIAKDQHGTANIPDILKANLASDFITYRVLYRFFHFSNSQTIDLWPVFEQEILPFCRSSLHEDVFGLWQKIKKNPFREVQRRYWRGPNAAWLYDQYDANCDQFIHAMNEILGTLTTTAQTFYNKHFQESSEPELELRVGLIREPSYDRQKRKPAKPAIGLGIRIGGTEITKPQTFLNEGKLSQIAISIRLAATLSNLQDAPLKLLVLDDLLISLDMSNRMKVVDIILGDDFANYQKIILTHKIGFFQEFRRNLGASHTDWCFKRFSGTPQFGIGLRQEKTDLQMAQDHLHRHELEEAAIRLRKAAEKTASLYKQWLTGKNLRVGEFHSLTDNLREAKNKLLAQMPTKLYQRVLKGLLREDLDKIVPVDDTDIDNDGTLSPGQKGKLKNQRENLRTLLKDNHWQQMKNVELLDQILQQTARVLNPATHGGTEPLYDLEVKKAIRLIDRFEKLLQV